MNREKRKENPLKSGFQPNAELDEAIERLTTQVAKGGGIGIVGNVIGRVMGFGLHILLGRVLGPGAYGLYALGTSVIGIAKSVASLGLNQGVVRFCAIYRGEGDNARVKGTILSALAISSISSVVAAAIVFAFSGSIAREFFHEPGLSWVLRIFALALPFSVLMGVTTSFAQSFRRIEIQQGVNNLFNPFAKLALVGLAFLLGFRLAGAVYGFLLSGVISAGVGLYFLKRIFPEIRSATRPAFDQTSKLVRFSLPMIFVAMTYFLALRTDRIMLGLLRNAKDVGIYNAAANIALQLPLIHSALVSIFMPIISDVYNKQRFSEMKELYDMVKRWSSYGTFFLALPIIFYPKLVMSIYGGEFVEGWGILLVLPAAYIIGSIAGPTGALLQMTGRQNIEFLNGFFMVTTNVLLNYFLIPIYGYLGAAIATLLATSFMNMVQLGQIYRFFGFHPFDLRHIGFVGLAAAIFVTGIAGNIFGNLVFNLPLFWLAIGLLIGYGYKTRTKEDIVIWTAVRNRLLGRWLQ